MRIRNVRQGDIPILIDILQIAAETDGFEAKELLDLEAWLVNPELEEAYSIFVITDDDESNEWGQGGTLEGVEGEVVGFTAVSLHENKHAYHFLCQGAVHPRYRRRNAGRALLICALNHARIVAAEFEFEAEKEGRPIYLEALLPLRDPASVNLAMKCEMQSADESQLNGMKLYRREL
jgi:ribosomal protein S18 acetylase RimI-like enzyme